MEVYPVLIYGGGNCEISARLQQEITSLSHLGFKQQKVYSRVHLLANSCLSMYKRLEVLKEQVDSTTSEGIHEYLYMGEGERVERKELKMSSASNPTVLEQFLGEGIEAVGEGEIVLILIGQSCKDGLFIDLYDMPPSYLSYKDMNEILYRVASQKQVHIHLILDIPIWDYMELPYRVAQNPWISTLFIWNRKEKIQLFPLIEWIEARDREDSITIKKIMQQGCELKLEYIRRDILDKNNYKEDINKVYPECKEVDFKKYFQELYKENISVEEIEKWMVEMKNCISYYKM